MRLGFSQAFINFPDAQWLHPTHSLSTTPDGTIRGFTESTFVGTKTGADGMRYRVEARMIDVLDFDIHGKIQTKNAFRKDRAAIPL